MSKGKGAKIQDYLNEDPVISSQRYALISIVGPNMQQKCDVWGLKIRGVADSLETAKVLTKRLMKLDKDYDIYTVDVGKFFPLAVEPYDVANVEYENEQLNLLVKNYLKNKEKANEHWHHRKDEMMKAALREGKSEGQDELANKPEHPIAVLQRIQTFDSKLSELTEQIDSLKHDIKLSKDKFALYTQEERDLADAELRKAIENNVDPNIPEQQSSLNIEEIRNEIMQELKDDEPKQEIQDILLELKSLEQEIVGIENTLNSISIEDAPSVHNTLSNQLTNLQNSRNTLTEKLNQSQSVNDYINSNYNEGTHDTIFN